MKRMMAAAIFSGLLAACGDSGYGGGGGGGGAGVGAGPIGSPAAPAPDATFSVSAANYDGVDYALWMEWQDDLGNLNQSMFMSLPAAPPGSFSFVSQDWSAISGFPYWLLLTDPSGNILDSLSIGVLSSGQIAPVSISVTGATLVLS